jgi:four helix bundle protein
MENKEFSKLLEKRTRKFAISIIMLSATLPNTAESKVVKNQITKSGTSIGANYREANRARSKADFRNKIKLCEGETSETIYWLELIEDLNWADSKNILLIHKEANELLALFSTISKNSQL